MPRPKLLSRKETIDLKKAQERLVDFINRYMNTSKSVKTQDDFAILTGIHHNRINLFLKSKAFPTSTDLYLIGSKCGMSIDLIMFGEVKGDREIKNRIASIEQELKEIKKVIR